MNYNKAKDDLTLEQVQEELLYNPDTGELLRSAGFQEKSGYKRVSIHGKTYMVHRVAWLLHYGEWPNGEIDHIDGDPSNNSINNLRLAMRVENVRNQKTRITNTSGYKGVSWRKKEKKWHASIRVGSRRYGLGFYSDIKDAANARAAKEAELHGAFRRTT